MPEFSDMEAVSGSLTKSKRDEDSNVVVSPKLWLISTSVKVLRSPLAVWLGVAISVCFVRTRAPPYRAP